MSMMLATRVGFRDRVLTSFVTTSRTLLPSRAGAPGSEPAWAWSHSPRVWLRHRDPAFATGGRRRCSLARGRTSFPSARQSEILALGLGQALAEAVDQGHVAIPAQQCHGRD